MTRVLHVLPKLCSDGPSKGIAWLTKYLERQGFDVLVCSLSEPTTGYAGMKVESLNQRGAADLRVLPALRSLIQRFQPHIVHTHLLRPDWYGRLAAAMEHVDVICTSVRNQDGSTYRTQYGRLSATGIELVNRFTGRFADRFIAVSEGVREYLITSQRVAPDRVVVIPNGVDLEEYKPRQLSAPVKSNGRIIVGTTAALKPQKGLAYLIEAARMVCEGRRDVLFKIAGEGPLRRELEQMSEGCGVLDNLEFVGQQSDVPAFLADLDIFVLPSLWEGMPRALLEAMAVGLPCVATDIGGSREVIRDGVDGLIVPAMNSSALARAIVSLADSPRQRWSFGTAANQRVQEHYSAAEVAERHAHLYEELLRGKDLAGRRGNHG